MVVHMYNNNNIMDVVLHAALEATLDVALNLFHLFHLKQKEREKANERHLHILHIQLMVCGVYADIDVECILSDSLSGASGSLTL